MFYATNDRQEKSPLRAGTSKDADAARTLLQGALDSMPKKAAKLAAMKVK